MSQQENDERRRDDRRRSLCRQPPYRTPEGIVIVDRRRQVDRRTNWLREIRLETTDERP